MISLFKKQMHPAGEYPKGYRNFSGYGGCLRCYTPWNKTKEHTTRYHSCKDAYHVYNEYKDESPCGGCFPLCQTCWESLTINQRLPYYEALVTLWSADGFPDYNGVPYSVILERLKASVLAGN